MKFNEERGTEWKWPHRTRDEAEAELTCLEGFFCPCYVYARAWARLHGALGGHNVPEPGLFSYECGQFILCFPFYGCMVSKLQQTVRAFYNIRGDQYRDWKDSCCCPCITLERNDWEIKTREEEHHGLREYHAQPTRSCSGTYESERPMTYAERPFDQNTGQLRTKPPSINGSKVSLPVPHTLTDHSAAPGHIIQPVHQIDDDMVSMTGSHKSARPHSLANDSVAWSGSPRSPAHQLGVDVKAVAQKFINKHDILTHPKETARLRTTGSRHDISIHEPQPRVASPAPHELSRHPKATQPDEPALHCFGE